MLDAPAGLSGQWWILVLRSGGQRRVLNMANKSESRMALIWTPAPFSPVSVQNVNTKNQQDFAISLPVMWWYNKHTFISHTFIQRLTLGCRAFPLIGRCRRLWRAINKRFLLKWCQPFASYLGAAWRACAHKQSAGTFTIYALNNMWTRVQRGYISRSSIQSYLQCVNVAGKTISLCAIWKHTVTSFYRYAYA